MSSEPNRTSLQIMVKLAVEASEQYLPCQPHETYEALAQTHSVWPLILSGTSYQILFLLLLLQFHYSFLACLVIHHSSSPIWKELQVQPNLQLLKQIYMWAQCAVRAHQTSKPYRHTVNRKGSIIINPLPPKKVVYVVRLFEELQCTTRRHLRIHRMKCQSTKIQPNLEPLKETCMWAQCPTKSPPAHKP